jgi:hypothetical protein
MSHATMRPAGQVPFAGIVGRTILILGAGASIFAAKAPYSPKRRHPGQALESQGLGMETPTISNVSDGRKIP